MTDLGKVEPSVYSDSKEYAFLSCHLLDMFDIFLKIMILNILAVWWPQVCNQLWERNLVFLLAKAGYYDSVQRITQNSTRVSGTREIICSAAMPQTCHMLLGLLFHVSMPTIQELFDDQCVVNALFISAVF